MNSNSIYINLGKVLKVHSAKGVIKAKLDLNQDFPLETLVKRKIWLSDQKTLSSLFWVENFSSHKDFFLIKLQGVNSFQEAETLIDHKVYLPKKLIIENLDPDCFLVRDLLGLKVFSGNSLVGEVVEFLNQTKEHQFLRIKLSSQQGKKKNFLLPMFKKFILKVDLKQQKLFINKNWPDLII